MNECNFRFFLYLKSKNIKIDLHGFNKLIKLYM